MIYELRLQAKFPFDVRQRDDVNVAARSPRFTLKSGWRQINSGKPACWNDFSA